MLQQRKYAWINRKKKAKSEADTGKYGKNINLLTHRVNEANKVSSSDLTSKTLAVTGARGRRGCKKNSLSQSQFLPPILATSKDTSLTLQPRKSTVMCVDDHLRGVGTWKPGIAANAQEKENQAIICLNDVSSPRSAYGCVAQLVPRCWDQKNSNQKDLEDFSKDTMKTQRTDLYRACFLVISSGKNEKKECNVLQINETPCTTIRDRTQRKLVQSKVPIRGISAWKSIEAFQEVEKAEEKLSSGDSAFGTDSCSETVDLDLEPGLEGDKMESTHYNHQRIINWIMEVNAMLFFPQTRSSVSCPLTEQDTSIKIVYDGD